MALKRPESLRCPAEGALTRPRQLAHTPCWASGLTPAPLPLPRPVTISLHFASEALSLPQWGCTFSGAYSVEEEGISHWKANVVHALGREGRRAFLHNHVTSAHRAGQTHGLRLCPAGANGNGRRRRMLGPHLDEEDHPSCALSTLCVCRRPLLSSAYFHFLEGTGGKGTVALRPHI